MSFERTELPSGTRVLTERIPGQRSVSLGVWVATGSRHEEPAVAGATHFLEHLVFKGTPTRSALEIAQAFDAVGGDLNAFTTKEFTCFHARVLGDDVPMTMEIIADMLSNASLSDDDLEAERQVVLEEIAMHEDTPDDIVYDLFHETMWPSHPLGRRVQGFGDTIAGMSRQSILGFYREHYAASSVVVSAAGAVDHAPIADLAVRVFPGSGRKTVGHPGAPPGPTGALGLMRRDIEQIHIVYGCDGIPRGDERRWALGVLNVALGGGMSSRLFQEIRERRGLAYAVGSSHQSFADAGTFTMYAGCSPDNAREVMQVAREQIDAVAADGITDEELTRAIGHLRGTLLVSLDDPVALMSHLGKSEICGEELLETEEMIRRIAAVTPAEVRAVAAAVLAGGDWSLAAVGPATDHDLSIYVGEAA